MASKIRIFRSTGATAPGSLEYGELAVTVEQGTAGTSANKAGRLFIGNASGNPVEIGGEYTYKLMDHTHGELINSSVAIVDSNGQINGWNVAGILTATRTNITDLVSTNLNVTGVATFTQDLNLNGNVTIGDSHTDVLTVEARAGFNTDVTLNRKLLVTGISTFTGAIDANGGANIAGGAGLVVSADGINVTGVSTFNDAVNFSSTIDVDGGAEFDDINVSVAATVGILTVTGNATVDGTLFVQGVQVSGGAVIGQDITTRNLKATGITTLGSTVNDLIDITGRAVFNTGINVTGVSSFVNGVFFENSIDVDGEALFDDVNVSAGATFAGAVDMNAGLDVSGGESTLSSATVSDLTSGRIVTVGTGGALQDDDNLRFDPTTGVRIGFGGLTVANGGINVSGISTFNHTVNFTQTIDVDGQAIFDDVLVSAGATFNGAVDMNAGLDVSGAETILSSATVSDLTDNRIVIAGSLGALEDDGNLTYDGTDLSTNSLKVTDLTNDRVLFAGTGGAVEDAAGFTFTGNTLSVPDLNVTGDARVGASLTVFGNLTVEGTETIINVERLDVQDKTVGVASTSTASNTTADGAGFFVHGGSDGDKQIFWKQDTGAYEVNVGWFPETDDALDLGNATHEWRNIFIDGTAELDDVNVSSAATIATADINGGAIDGTIIGAATTAAGTFSSLVSDSLTAGGTATLANVDINGGNIDGTVIGFAVTSSGTFSSLIGGSLTVGGTSTLANADINGGNIDGTVIGAASSAVGTFSTLNAGAIVTGGRLDAGNTTFTNLRVTGVSTVASLFLSTGTNTNGAAYFDANGQLQSTATPSAGIQTSNFILTTNASGVPSWTNTIDCGQF